MRQPHHPVPDDRDRRGEAALPVSQSTYDHVDGIARRLGADPTDQVPFGKYKAAESLLKPSSAVRAVARGAPFIVRVDLLVKLISHQLGMPGTEMTAPTKSSASERPCDLAGRCPCTRRSGKRALKKVEPLCQFCVS